MGKRSIRTEFYFEAAHQLNLSYESKCENLHGHSYKCAITITSKSGNLNQDGMIVDFVEFKKIIKQRIEDRLDHKFLNEIYTDVNSTAEYMAEWICNEITNGLEELNIDAYCSKVELNETAKNMAIYEV
jgi:6-pyruvoyltetrahydropterin/6-carboxytetrahydropterin synthase